MANPIPATDDIPARARDAIANLTANASEPVKLLISGGTGTGKSAVLAAAREAYKKSGYPVITRAPRPGDPTAARYLIDDVHLLNDEEVSALNERMAAPEATVVVASEPLTRRDALRTLMTSLARENAVVSLGGLGLEEVSELLSSSELSPPPEVLRTLMMCTAGLPFLMPAAIAAVANPEGDNIVLAIGRATSFALIDRLRRLDGPVLDTLLICSLIRDLGPDDVAAALRTSIDEAHLLVDRARATGLIEAPNSETFLRALHDGVAQIIGAGRHHEIEVALLTSQIEMSTLSIELALRMAEHGLRDERLAQALTELAANNRGRPAEAARLYRAAADAGATALDSRLADALAQTGDCVAAGRLADEQLSSTDPDERAAAVRIAASIAVHDGSVAQGADLFRWLGPHPDAFVSIAGALVAVAVGDVDMARQTVSVNGAGPPTSTARAARSLAEGLLLSLDQPFPVTIARLAQAVSAEHRPRGIAPDTPAAVVTLAALHGGDAVRARSVISRAVLADTEDDAFFAIRHRLLLGWVKMLDGQLDAASADAAIANHSTLHRRDALWAAALQTALARRGGDSGAMQKHWTAAMDVLAEYSVDLFSLLPLCELWIAAARLNQVDRIKHTLTVAFDLLNALGDPVLWSVPLHWAGVHAGILTSSPESIAPHGQALTAAASRNEFAKALAGAGRTWLRVLANHVEIDEVTAVARALAQYGLTWDATRLASQAALQTPDGRVSAAMLQLARDLKLTVADQDVPDPTSDLRARPPAGRRAPTSRLSEREREVAQLLLLGLPYRDIGDQLFISAKTVEHHVARIRRRLDAESRSEMLSMLRAILAPPS